jgi:cytochrome c oxidase subunit 1
MPRRIPDYADGYAGWNHIMSFGSILTIISVFLFLYIVSNVIFINKKYYLNPLLYIKYINWISLSLYKTFTQNPWSQGRIKGLQ